MAALCIGLSGSPVLEKRIGRASAKRGGGSSSSFIYGRSSSAAREAKFVALRTCGHAGGHGRDFFAGLGRGRIVATLGQSAGQLFRRRRPQSNSKQDGRKSATTPSGSQTAVARSDSQPKNASAPGNGCDYPRPDRTTPGNRSDCRPWSATTWTNSGCKACRRPFPKAWCRPCSAAVTRCGRNRS